MIGSSYSSASSGISTMTTGISPSVPSCALAGGSSSLELTLSGFEAGFEDDALLELSALEEGEEDTAEEEAGEEELPNVPWEVVTLWVLV